MLDNLPQIQNKYCSGCSKRNLVDVRQLSVLFFLLVSGIVSPAVNAEGELTPYVDFSVVKDDNLYRLDSDVNANALSLSKDDIIYQTKAGLAVDWELSRQKILADFSITDNRFENNSTWITRVKT